MDINNALFIILALTGAVFIVAGFFLHRYPPKEINKTYGYRTKRSMESQEAWEFAQRHSAREMFLGGLICLIISFIGAFFKISATIGSTIGVFILVAVCIIMMYRTERALSDRF